MSEERKPHVWPWITALLIGLPVSYVASFGPACWLLSGDLISYDHFNCAYRPLVNLAFGGPEIVRQFLCPYAHLWGSDQALRIAYLVGNAP